ncbi:MAG: TIGR04282 family arsenosugar biosynthesis glycosyltransferase [Caldilinea sp.]
MNQHGIWTAPRRALFVVAKEPAAGQTKTRLCPPLRAEEAAALYASFLADTLDIMRRVSGVRCSIAYLPPGAEAYFSDLAPEMTLVLQQGESLGERLDHLITQALANGAMQAVVMDSDSPTLPAAYVAQAFDLLDGNIDAVFGPCRDGGYYLVGMKRPLPALLREVQMSTPTVLADTLAIAAREGVRVALLPEWYDVDTGEELAHLAHELHITDAKTAQHTRRGLAALAWSANGDGRNS